MSRRTMEERFEAKIDRSRGECWLWTGRLAPNGYGVFAPGPKSRLVHRFSYEYFVGPIPEGLHIDHLCRVRHCVNPAHLEAVTQRENLRRGIGFPGENSRKTHCDHGHEFTPENTYVYPSNGKRKCRTCHRAHQRARWERSKAWA